MFNLTIQKEEPMHPRINDYDDDRMVQESLSSF